MKKLTRKELKNTTGNGDYKSQTLELDIVQMIVAKKKIFV